MSKNPVCLQDMCSHQYPITYTDEKFMCCASLLVAIGSFQFAHTHTYAEESLTALSWAEVETKPNQIVDCIVGSQRLGLAHKLLSVSVAASASASASGLWQEIHLLTKLQTGPKSRQTATATASALPAARSSSQ